VTAPCSMKDVYPLKFWEVHGDINGAWTYWRDMVAQLVNISNIICDGSWLPPNPSFLRPMWACIFL
jgi:hypothetical protein